MQNWKQEHSRKNFAKRSHKHAYPGCQSRGRMVPAINLLFYQHQAPTSACHNMILSIDCYVASIACRNSKSRSRGHESLDYNPEFCLKSTCNLWVLTVPRASKMWCICVCVHACIHACMCAWCIEGGQGKRGDKRVYAWQLCTVHACASRSKRYTACLLWVCVSLEVHSISCVVWS